MQYRYEINASASLTIPSILSCKRSLASKSDVTDFIKGVSDWAESLDFIVRLSVPEIVFFSFLFFCRLLGIEWNRKLYNI
jgi:hypothetical protein